MWKFNGYSGMNSRVAFRLRSKPICIAMWGMWGGFLLGGCANAGMPPSTKDTTPPTAPTNLMATATLATSINLTWTASTDNVGVAEYKVERCSGAGCANFAQITTPATAAFNDTGLTASTSYSYRVRAADAAGNNSAYSNVFSTTTSAGPDTTPPTVPTNLAAAAASATAINLTWTASTDNVGVAGYKVERCSGAGCVNFAQIAAPATAAFNDTGLAASTSYSYRVRATDAAGNLSGYSNTSSATTPPGPDTTPPTAPTNLAATAASATAINLTWTASTDNVGVTGYKVERCSGTGCVNFAQIAAPTTTTFNDTGLTASTSYSYRVRATDAAGNLSGYSNTSSATTPPGSDTTPPTAPTNLMATGASATAINLAWTASTDNVGVTGYKVERCSGAGCANFAQIAAPTTTSFNDTGLIASTSYSYRVRATDAAGNLSAYSSVAAATTSAPTLTAPSNLTATAAGSTQINLSWSAASEAGGTISQYLVERCQGAGCANFAQVGTSATVAFNDTGLAASTSYSYRVRATDASNNLSGYSNTATATTAGGNLPTAPANLTSTAAGPVQISLSWTASTETGGTISKYLVERCKGAGCNSFAQVGTSTTTSFGDTGLAGSSSYSYRVRASDTANNLGPYSSIATATTAAPTLTAPSNLTATAASSTQIGLTWTASTETGGTISNYLVERCSAAGCSNFAQIATPTTTPFSDAGLTASTSYSYRVRATDAAGNLSGYSNAAATSTLAGGNSSVTISPRRGGITTTQTLPFTATVTNDVGGAGVTWSMTGGTLTGQTLTGATFSSTTAGVFTITAKSNADVTKSASATIGVTNLSGVLTYHNDLARDGANTQEYALTTATVGTATFGKLFSCTADGAIYAQPLWVPGVTIGGVTHNVVIVATQHDSVYAFDADASPCITLWHANLLDTSHGGAAGETSVPSGTSNSLVGSGFGDIMPEVGVTGTPVIDTSTSAIYVVSKSAVSNALPVRQRLHALSLTSGSEKTGSPVNIDGTISVTGTGDGSVSGKVAFDPRNEHQRPGLALVNGVVYVSWASHEDHDPYHGWVIGFNTSPLGLATGAVFNSTPNKVGTASYSRGGIWMGGGAPAADSSGNLYFLTGNGTFDANAAGSNYGDSTMKLSTTNGLNVLDWFTPADQSVLDGNDTDHGSGGAAVLVTTANGSFVIGGGKEGNLFMLKQSSLGRYGASVTPVNSNAYQIFGVGNGIFSTAAFWNNSLYIGPANATLQAFPFDTSTGMFRPGSATSTGQTIGFPGATPSISARGTTNGILWAIDNSLYCTAQSPACGAAVLHAFDATQLSSELWNSTQAAGDQAGDAVKFTVPTVANGKVYIGTRGNDTGNGGTTVPGEIDVYGLKPN